MADVNITIPIEFIKSMSEFVRTLNEFQKIAQKLIQAIQHQQQMAANIQTAQKTVRNTASRFQSLHHVLQKIASSFAGAISKLVNLMGTAAKKYITAMQWASSALGPEARLIAEVGGAAIKAGITLAQYAYRFTKWMFDKIVELADNMLQDYLFSTGTFSTIGGLRAFRAVFGGMFPGSEEIFSQVAQARGDPTSAQFRALALLGIKNTKDTADMSVSMMLAAAKFMKAQPRGLQLKMAGAFDITSVIDVVYLMQLTNMRTSELEVMIAEYELLKSKLQYSKKAIEGWKDFSEQMKITRARIQNIIGEELANPASPFTKAIQHLSEAFEHLLEVITKNVLSDKNMEIIKKYIELLVKWMGDPKNQKKIEKAVKLMAQVAMLLLKAAELLVDFAIFIVKVLPPFIKYGFFGGFFNLGFRLGKSLGERLFGPRTVDEEPLIDSRTGLPIEGRPGRLGPHGRVGVPHAPGITRAHVPGTPHAHVPGTPHAHVPGTPPAPGSTGSPGTPFKQPREDVDEAITKAAKEYNMDPATLRAIASVESSFSPNSNYNRPTQYKGLFQIGRSEWAQYGGNGNIYSAEDNARAAAHMLSDHAKWFKRRFGRDPTPGELYLMHQQGPGFYSRGAMTNIGGNPYPGMRGPQTHESFEAGWTREIERRRARLGAGPNPVPASKTTAPPPNAPAPPAPSATPAPTAPGPTAPTPVPLKPKDPDKDPGIGGVKDPPKQPRLKITIDKNTPTTVPQPKEQLKIDNRSDQDISSERKGASEDSGDVPSSHSFLDWGGGAENTQPDIKDTKEEQPNANANVSERWPSNNELFKKKIPPKEISPTVVSPEARKIGISEKDLKTIRERGASSATERYGAQTVEHVYVLGGKEGEKAFPGRYKGDDKKYLLGISREHTVDINPLLQKNAFSRKQTLTHELGHVGRGEALAKVTHALPATKEGNEEFDRLVKDYYDKYHELTQEVSDIDRLMRFPARARITRSWHNEMKEAFRYQHAVASGVAKEQNITEQEAIAGAREFENRLNKAAGKLLRGESLEKEQAVDER